MTGGGLSERSGSRSRFPDFLCIGAQKCGTTWLHLNLSQHEDIWLPKWKEIHYFDRAGRPVPGWADALRPIAGRKLRANLGQALREELTGMNWRQVRTDLRFYLARRDLDWYLSLFPPDDDERLVGEITPAYSILPANTVAQIATLNPDLKVIFLMRNPIERTWSSAVMGHQQETSSDASHPDLEGVRRLTEKAPVVRRDDYLGTIDTWSAVFPSTQIFIGFLEDIHFRPDAFLSRLTSFLGVDDHVAAPSGKQHARSADYMPADVARYLARRHHSLVSKLAGRFAGPPQEWLAIADWLLSDTETEVIDYPLWNTAPGRSLRHGQTDLVSGPLSSLQQPPRPS